LANGGLRPNCVLFDGAAGIQTAGIGAESAASEIESRRVGGNGSIAVNRPWFGRIRARLQSNRFNFVEGIDSASVRAVKRSER
jgi:hypothetical protein